MKMLERQYLIEAETKLEALQHRLDGYYPDYPPKMLVQQYYDTLDYVNRLKAELNEYTCQLVAKSFPGN